MPLLYDLHWLRIPARITIRLAFLAYRCQNGLAPQYLADDLHQVAEVESQRRLRSAATAALIVPATARSTICDLCRCRLDVEQPSALGDVISVPSGFPEASEDSFIYLVLPVVATLSYVLYRHLV